MNKMDVAPNIAMIFRESCECLIEGRRTLQVYYVASTFSQSIIVYVLRNVHVMSIFSVRIDIQIVICGLKK